MKNDYAIITSDLSKGEYAAASCLLDAYRYKIKGYDVKKAIKVLRKDMEVYGDLNFTEKDLENACAFHNVLNEYVATIK
jgi:hypothetical protein